MAKTAIIPIVIASPPDPAECTANYFVRYKLTGDPSWTLLNGDGYAVSNPIEIAPLEASTGYDYEITRNCCNAQSATTTGSFTTTA